MVQEVVKPFTFENGSSAVVSREKTGAVSIQFTGVQHLDDVLEALNYAWTLEEDPIDGPSSQPALNKLFADFGTIFGGAA